MQIDGKQNMVLTTIEINLKEETNGGIHLTRGREGVEGQTNGRGRALWKSQRACEA